MSGTKFLNINDAKIAYIEHFIRGSRFGVVIIHGMAEHKGRYDDLINELVKNNISVFAVDLRGHGESYGKRGDARNFKEFLSDLDGFVEFIKIRYSELKIVLFGHSFGGQISFVYSAMKNNVEGLVLSSPLLCKPRNALMLNFVPHKLFGWVRLKKRHSESLEMLEYSRNDLLALKNFSLRMVGIMFKDGMRQVNRYKNNLRCPTFVMLGKNDPLIDCSKNKNFFYKLNKSNVEAKVYEDGKHRLVQNEGRFERIKDIVDWINSLDEKT